MQVDTPDAARSAVDEVVGKGADVIKIGVDHLPDQAPRIGGEVLAAVVDEARRRGVRAVAHIGTVEDALDAARAGVAAWMHGVYKERIPDETVPVLAAFQIPMVATTVVFESYALIGQGPRAPTPLERETAPADILAAFDHVPASYDFGLFGPYLEKMRAQRQAWRDNVNRLHEAGVTILAGGDMQAGAFPGAGLPPGLDPAAEPGLRTPPEIPARPPHPARLLPAGQGASA